jgi:serine/threonine protein kinase
MQSDPAEQWRLLSEELGRVLELTEADRAAWLAQLNASAPEMAAKLERLLANCREKGFSQFLEGSVFSVPESMEQATLVGRTVGAYTIAEEIGRGGMGSVWRAKRVDGRFQSEVAIKFVHAAWLGGSGEQRFRVEGNLLGQLNHPNIARLLDAGVMDGSQPYLVLEYVKGEPIDTYCRRHELNVEVRVRLFLDVLAAVAHAHSHLIVHRDIKPTNVFVTEDGTVKLLDFGIAKLLDEPGSGGLTKSAVALTPQYAAPEQLTGQKITTATDVYSLGLVLYQLLTGKSPHAGYDASSAGLIQAVLTEDPPRPSVAATESPIRPRSLQGDLDNIILKALKKTPAERYPSAEAFAADLRGYLNHEPISARRDSFIYVIGKMIRKRRLQVSAALAILLALVAGVTGTALQAREARLQKTEALTERDKARAQLERHDAIFDFVQMMLTDSVPPDEVPAVQSMLDRSLQFIDIASAGKANRQAEILSTLASYYVALDNPQRANELLGRASKLAESSGDLSLQARLACDYGASLNMLGRSDEAVKIFEQWGGNPSVDGDTAGYCLQSRAVVAQNQGNAGDALTYTDFALQRVAQSDAPSARFLAELAGDRGFALHMAGRNAEADHYFESALQQFKRLGVENSRPSQVTMANWALVDYGCGDYKRGFDIYAQLLQFAEQRAGAAPVSPGLLGNYAHGLEAMGRYPEALKAYQRTFESAEKTGFIGAQAYALIGQASIHALSGELTQAQSDLDRAAAIMHGKIGDSSAVQQRRLHTQAQIDVALDRRESALFNLNKIIQVSTANNALGSSSSVNAYRLRADIQLREGKIDEAEADARKAVLIAEHLQGANRFSGDTGLAYLTLAGVLTRKPDRTRAQEALRAAIDHLTNALGEEHPDTLQSKRLLSRL